MPRKNTNTKRGFAAMDEDERREVARRGGKHPTGDKPRRTAPGAATSTKTKVSPRTNKHPVEGLVEQVVGAGHRETNAGTGAVATRTGS
ncbi:: KGG [Gemmata massiliana]|uniref:: KGG n=1 Tax=Gemmata massiliana TaxID=1210884 RepID=A0A6P2CW64_9BACT|nr:hypothetical protein [Gemmata massiliana]VTR92847.1 : KGG [Gemmata massiliana]